MKSRVWLSVILLSMAVFLFAGVILHAQESVDPVKYEIWVNLDAQLKMLDGRESITWHNTSPDAIADIWFHLYWNAFKNEKSAMMEEIADDDMAAMDDHGEADVKDGDWGWIDVKKISTTDGIDLAPTMEFMIPDQPPHPGDQTVMRVKLPKPLLPGESIGLELAFVSKIPRTIRRSGYYHNGFFIGQWFPKPGVYQAGKGWNCHQYHLNSEFFADFAEYKVHITVPENYVLGASGREISERRDPQHKLKTVTYWQNRIHDFAWTADPDYLKIERPFAADQEVTAAEYQELAGILHLPVEQLKLPDVNMILLINPEHRHQTERHFRALRAALKYYGLWYGAYPYPTVTMVDPPFRSGSGGMEYPTLFTAGTQIFPSRLANSPEMVIIHEFGHGYWYGLAANNEFEEAWLDEGINTYYATGRVLAKAYGPGAFPLTVSGIPYTRYSGSLTYSDLETDRAAGIHIVTTDPVINPSWQYFSSVSYALNVYMRASTCLQTLERFIGPDAMLLLMRQFQTRFRFKHPTSRDFIALANEVSGRDLNWFFTQLFFGTSEWDFGIAGVTSHKQTTSRGVFDEGSKKIAVTARQAREMDNKRKNAHYTCVVRVRRYGEARPGDGVMLKIKVAFADGSTEIREWDGQGRWRDFAFLSKSPVASAQIDPDNVFLIDCNLTNNSFRIAVRSAGAFRWASKVLFWMQNLLQLAGHLI